jgi:hypothetical protein
VCNCLTTKQSSVSRWTFTDAASNMTVQLALHSCPMDNNDNVRKAWTMCTQRATGGTLGNLSLASCVDYMMVPFGFAMPIGCMVHKWAVLPL